MDLLSVGRGAAQDASRWLQAGLLALAVGLGGCPAGGPADQVGLGKRLWSGSVRSLPASADGAWLALLDGCVEVKGRLLPVGTATCDLKMLSTSGGDPRLVARGVPTLAHGAVFAPEGGALAVLADYDFESGSGTLLVARDGVAREVARGVTFHGFVPGSAGALLAVAGGTLWYAPPQGAPRQVTGGAGVASFELAQGPGDAAMVGLTRQPIGAGGALLALSPGFDRARLLATGTTEYGLSRHGDLFAYAVREKAETALWLGRGGKARRIGPGARLFTLAPGGEAVAWISEVAPGRQGDLQMAVPGGEPARLAREVGEFRWATAAPRLAWLEQYDPRGRAGVLGVGGPGVAPRRFGKNVTDFELSADGERVTFLRHTVEGGYSVDLWSGEVAGEPRQVARGVFGFSFSPDGRWVYYRTRCTRNGDACDLERVAAGGVAALQPELIAAAVKSFEFDPRDPGRLLVTWQRADLVALDFGVWRDGKMVQVDRGALPGSIRFLGPDSRRLSYAVVQAKRAGAYVAVLPVPVSRSQSSSADGGPRGGPPPSK